MPQPMPPQPGQQPPAQAQQSPQGQVAQLVTNVGKGLEMVAGLLAKSGAPQEIAQRMQGVLEEYRAVVGELTGGGGESAQPQPSASPMEAGASRGAAPEDMRR